MRKAGNYTEAEMDQSIVSFEIRPATAADVRVGAVLLHVEGDDGPFIRRVDEVLSPSDPWKAYCADDGCRYGLEDCYYVPALQQSGEHR